ncbi:MAG TPA: ATP-binding protein [Burkholderiaceae bacterium]|nr:ATP-binding protein [Burkholderiaceae bacterium]
MTQARRVPLPDGQAELLEMIAKGAPLKETLERLLTIIEAQSEGLFCSILLLDPDGLHIHPGAGPRMPTDYMALLDGFAIGPLVGSCGTAMYRKEAVVVTDIMEDPLWTPYKHLVEPHGFRACWSTPIFLNRHTVLGSFAMYYCDVRSPGPVELQLIAVATHIAGIAIERKRNEEELNRYHHELEDLVKLRTAEMCAEKENAEAAVFALQQSNLELANALTTLSVAQEELVHSKKLVALGSLVAGIAHELNTPIGNCMMIYSTLADQALALGEQFAREGSLKRSELSAYFDNSRDAGEILLRNLHRAADLIFSFKQIAVDQTSSSRRSFLLDETINEIVLTLSPRLKNTPFVIKQDVADGVQFDSYPGPLGQVLDSLIENALVHAFEGRAIGTVFISAGQEKAGWIELCVKDDGVGIPPENIERIFDPFFTTKLGIGGSGLGLNIMYNIVSGVLGGQVLVHSELRVGTTFTILLPVVAPKPATTGVYAAT